MFQVKRIQLKVVFVINSSIFKGPGSKMCYSKTVLSKDNLETITETVLLIGQNFQ